MWPARTEPQYDVTCSTLVYRSKQDGTDVSVCNFIFKLMGSGSRRVLKEMIDRRRMERRRIYFIYDLCCNYRSLCLRLKWRGLFGCWVAIRSHGIVTWNRFLSKRMRRATFNQIVCFAACALFWWTTLSGVKSTLNSDTGRRLGSHFQNSDLYLI